MPRRPSTDSAAPLMNLHPVLQTTLHCMDVRLEDELARYRRARRRSPVQSRWGEGQAIINPGVSTIEPTPPVAETAALAIAPTLASHLKSESTPTSPAVPEASTAPLPSPQTEGYADYLESSEHLLRSLADDEAELRTESAPRMMDTLLTPLGVGSMVLLLLSSVTLGYIITNPSSLSFLSANAPAEGETTTAATTPSNTPTSADSEPSFYPDLSSEEFRDLNLDTLSTLPEDGAPETSTTPAAPTINPSPTAPAAARTQSVAPSGAPTNPSTAQPSRTASAPTSRPATTPQRPTSAPQRPTATPSRAASPRPAATRPAPAASPRPAARPSSAARPSPAARPAPTASRPAPSRPAPAPSTVAAAPARPSTYYYVVTDYTGDRSLNSARSAVSDAYVRNFEIGAVVQFGAFQEEARAEALLQDLQQQGIQARIYRAESN